MNHLSDFKPLSHVELPGIDNLRCSGLTIIVGPNSSGKTQLLRDLATRLSGEERELIVAKEVRLDNPEFEPFMECLRSEGYIEPRLDSGGTERWHPRKTYLGTGEVLSEAFTHDEAQEWHQGYMVKKGPTKGPPDLFLQNLGRLLVTSLFLDRRLSSPNQVGIIDFMNNPPQNDLQVLYLNDNAQENLSDELLKSFNKGVWLDQTQGNRLGFRVTDQAELPSDKDRVSPTKMAEYRTIETEGDGLKSYVATAVALLLGRRPICLIDEPEMCLHPPQANNLGRFIGVQASSPYTATFVATHSSEVLRGALQTGENIQVVRLVRRQGAFLAHLLSDDDLKEAIAKPTVRTESVLDGIFAESVVVVEAEGDRLVYQAVWETLSGELPQDIHFTTVGGTGGVPSILSLYSRLSVPAAVITDLDILADHEQLRRILAAGVQPSAVGLADEAHRIMELIQGLAPIVTEAEIQEDMSGVQAALTNWTDDNDGGGILKKCVNSQAVYPLSEQHGLKARERRYTAHEEGKHWE